MFRKNDKGSSKRQEANDRDFIGNVPTGQSRKVISPFVDRQIDSDSARNLDNFQRGEGYQPFTPRAVGMPMSENDQGLDSDSSTSQVGGKNEQSKKRPSRTVRLLKRIL